MGGGLAILTSISIQDVLIWHLEDKNGKKANLLAEVRQEYAKTDQCNFSEYLHICEIM